ERSLDAGATELDMVINIGALVGGAYEMLEQDIAAVASIVHQKSPHAILKVIIETALLSEEQKIVACRAVTNAGADFIKTSTGFSSGGATVEDVQLMKRSVGENVRVKASGGIRDLRLAQALLAAGASRIGTSSGVALVRAVVERDKHATGQYEHY
ncbi:MAG: deoxyribose-phosphate aldolase, partial [Bacteroidota bacterium]|nr:deoxyribose-phosphate aldolase [Candidatus Kapabacteria bacterium]MDW8220655.1 deoxyribose-phosphate aldolase [Bacteroidota bacterium]